MKKKVLVAGVLMVLIGCGGGESGGGSGDKTDTKDVIEMVENPTGTLTQENVDDVVNEFITLYTSKREMPTVYGGFAPQTEYCRYGICCDVSGDKVVCDCPVSGSMITQPRPSESDDGYFVKFSYDNCVVNEEGCAIDGEGITWSSTATFMGGEVVYVFSGTLCGNPIEIYCFYDGEYLWYPVEVNGETFAVRGYYDNRDGEVWIKDSTREEYYCSIENDEIFCEGLD